jgi:hypothetical protein
MLEARDAPPGDAEQLEELVIKKCASRRVRTGRRSNARRISPARTLIGYLLYGTAGGATVQLVNHTRPLSSRRPAGHDSPATN